MKTSKMIIESITKKRQYRPLLPYGCYGRFINSLSPSLKRAISFIFVKDNALFLALSHPGYKMELNYNKDVIKSLLRVFAQINPECKFMSVDKIIVFESKYSISKLDNKDNEDTIPRYPESAEGNFRILARDRELREHFEKIKDDIKRNRVNL